MQPDVGLPSLTHIAQVCGGWTIKNPVNAKLRARFAYVLEEAPPAAEQQRDQGDFQFVDDTQGQVLLDHFRAARNANVGVVSANPEELNFIFW
jgi:hypothetical protein